jgi:hypothetical protein
MPDYLIESFEYAVLVLLVLLTIMLVIVLIMSLRHAKYLTNRKYRISTLFEHEPMIGKETFAIHVFNNNLTDSRLSGLGYIYKHQTIDYYKTYLKQIESSLAGKIVIPTRDSIKVDVDIDRLLEVIELYNHNKLRVKKLKCFVTDALGMTTVTNAKTIRKVIRIKLKDKRKQKKREKVLQREKQKEERRSEEARIREDKKESRKARFDRARIRIREFLGKIKKKR